MIIGILGGSFDPIHSGHAIVANYALQWGGLDEVWIMVSPRNPLKSSIEAPDISRLEMARMVFNDSSEIHVSDFEFSLPVPSYTYNTLKKLQERFPEHEFKLIIGSDYWIIFNKWRDSEKIIEEYGLIIYPRPGFDVDKDNLPENVKLLEDAPQVVMSSTFIRDALKNDKNINFFVPREVCRYIESEKLYR